MTRWTNEEAVRLLELALANYKIPSGVVDWEKVMDLMPGRTKAYCYTYINNFLRRRGYSKYSSLRHNYRWTYEDEDKLLLLAKQFNNNWQIICERYFPELTVRRIKNKHAYLVKKQVGNDAESLQKLIALLAES